MKINIHKSHSRRDLIDIIKLFKLQIEDPDDLNKAQVTEALTTCLEDLEDIIPDTHFYGICNVNQLKEYLILPNQKKTLSIKDKNEIMKVSKLIIQYCKGGYCTELSYFENIDQIYSEARRLSQYGDIPSVRRMCNLLNQNPHSNEVIMPIISKKIQKDLEIKKLTSKKIHNSLVVRYGTFKVDFS